MENWLKGIVGILLSCFRVGCSDNCFRVVAVISVLCSKGELWWKQ